MFLNGWIVSTTGKSAYDIEGPSSILSHNKCYRLQPVLTSQLVYYSVPGRGGGLVHKWLLLSFHVRKRNQLLNLLKIWLLIESLNCTVLVCALLWGCFFGGRHPVFRCIRCQEVVLLGNLYWMILWVSCNGILSCCSKQCTILTSYGFRITRLMSPITHCV